jgi:hypothetical protein
MTATVLRADGSSEIERFQPAAAPQVDCFYIYPTVSHSPGLAADPVVTRDEHRAVMQQVERLTSVCRLFAPLYRQVTVTSMLVRDAHPKSRKEAIEAARLAQADVLAAWDDYMTRDNGGRGVILVGHSQGAGILIELIRRRIDGTAAQGQLVSALLPGAGIMVPQGQETGGTFKSIPPCRSEAQVGCVISFNMVRTERPIPAGMIQHPKSWKQVCTNPAALAGGAGWLKPYLSSTGETIIPDVSGPQPSWSKLPLNLRTPFLTVPGLYEATCGGDGAYVAVSAIRGAGDVRTGALTGDWLHDGAPEPTMGLHLIDLNLAVGNLEDIVRCEARAYLEAHPARLVN